MAAVALGAATPVGAAGWSTPRRLAGPVWLDATPIQIAFSPAGQAAASFGFFDPDAPAGARASVASLSTSGRVLKVRAVPHTRQVLDLAYVGGALQILGATSGGGLACCTQIQTLTLGGRGFSATHTLMRRLRGVSLGQLLASGSGSVVVFAADNGVWTARAARADARYDGVHRLSAPGSGPQSLVVAPLHGGGSLVAFAQTPFHSGDAPIPPKLMLSQARGPRLPPSPRIAQTFPAGTVIGPVALAPNPLSPTLGWAQDSAEASGGVNSSAIVLATVGPTLHTRAFTVAGEIESGLSGAADATGDELFAWESCDTTPVCHVLAVSRPSRGRFGSARTLGTIDAAAEPAVAVGPHGAAAIAWVQSGHIFVTRRASGSQRFSAPRQLRGAGPASGLRLAAGPGGRLLAVWAAGTTRTTLWASQLG